MNKIGIMQGRLSNITSNSLDLFPIKEWHEEFELASKIGFDYIELICDKKSLKDNPINSSSGIQKIIDLVKLNNLKLISVCNNFIIDNSIWHKKSTYKQNFELIKRIEPLKIKYYILPLVGKSDFNKIEIQKAKMILENISRSLLELNCQLLIETNLDVDKLKFLIKNIKSKNISILYDVGNLSSLRGQVSYEIEELGNLIGHIHIKDKNQNGDNVRLGTGIVDFNKIFIALKKINYKGCYTLETTPENNPLKTALAHRNFLLKYL